MPEKFPTIEPDYIALISLVGDMIYKKIPVKQVPVHEPDLTRLLNIASENKVLYCASVRLMEHYKDHLRSDIVKHIQRVGKIYQLYVVRLRKTIHIIKKYLDEYLIFKTEKGYPYITHDVDVLVKDPISSAKILMKVGLKPTHWSKYEVYLLRKDTLGIHLYGGIIWNFRKFADDEFVWDSIEEKNFEIAGTKIKAPSAECEFLANIAHINFETRQIPLGDLLYIFMLMTNVNLEPVVDQAITHSWSMTLIRSLAMLNYIHRAIYERPSPLESKFPYTLDVDVCKMPVVLPKDHIILSIVETRIIHKIALSLLGNLHLFLNKRAVQRLMPRLKSILST